MGQPHNKVFGIISYSEPKNTVDDGPGNAYDWSNDEHRDLLIELSQYKYPYEIPTKRSGHLWVVINDVDQFRWDNGGLFWLKLTRHPRFALRR